MDIGKALKELRKIKGLNQTQAAEAAGITQTAYSQIETGVAQPHKNTLEKIAAGLDTTPAVIAIMSIEESDVPEHKKKTFKQLFPSVKELVVGLLEGNPDDIIK